MDKNRITNVPLLLSFGIIILVVFPIGIYNSYKGFTRFHEEENNLKKLYIGEVKKQLDIEIENISGWIHNQVSTSEDKVKLGIEAHSDIIFSLLEGLNKHNPELFKNEKEIESIRDIIGGIRYYEKNGYYFAVTPEGVGKVYPPDINIEETDMLNLQGPDGKYIIRDMISIVNEEGEGFYKYMWPDPLNRTSVNTKISYVKYFKPLNWIVGTGIHASYVHKGLQNDMVNGAFTMKSKPDEYFFILDDSARVIAGEFPEILNDEPSKWINKIIEHGKDAFGDYTYVPNKSKNGDLPELIIRSSYFPEWQWTFAVGVSNERFFDLTEKKRERVRKEVRQALLFVLFIMLLAITLIIIMSLHFKKQIENSFETFTDFFRKARSKYNLIDFDRMRFREFRKLARYANEMIEERRRKDKIIKEFTKKLKQANLKLKEIAHIDGLTQVANRRRFDEVLKSEWQRSMRNRNEISLCLMDIDFFKIYNDTYGHQKGDECLKMFADALKGSLKRPADLVARYGGEEFVVLLPGTGTEGAEIIAEKMRKNVSELGIKHEGSKVSDIVTFSVGIATTVPEQGSNSDSIVANADKALYQAKSEGRNRSKVYMN